MEPQWAALLPLTPITLWWAHMARAMQGGASQLSVASKHAGAIVAALHSGNKRVLWLVGLRAVVFARFAGTVPGGSRPALETGRPADLETGRRFRNWIWKLLAGFGNSDLETGPGFRNWDPGFSNLDGPGFRNWDPGFSNWDLETGGWIGKLGFGNWAAQTRKLKATQPARKPANQASRHPASKPTEKPAHHQPAEHAVQPASQPCQPTSQPASQLTS